MSELFKGLASLTFWEYFADFHGTLAMLSLVLFGAGIVLYKVALKDTGFVAWLKNVLLVLFFNLVALDIAGLTAYVPYRAPTDTSPRTILKSIESTKWLHTIVFEHKEFLAFAPPLIILVAYLITKRLGSDFNSKDAKYYRKAVIFSLVIALIFTLLVAGEAVLVTKAQPVR